jgi:hypothetical protein
MVYLRTGEFDERIRKEVYVCAFVPGRHSGSHERGGGQGKRIRLIRSGPE